MALAGSYEVVVKNAAKAVIKPLKICMCSLNSVYEALIDADVHPVTGYCSNYGYIRTQIEQAWWSLQRSDEAASTCLRSLDKSLETLTQDEGKLERKKNDTKEVLGHLRTKKDSNKEMLKESQGALKQAERNLSSARRTVEEQEKREANAKVGLAVGLGITPIPFVGWVVGPAMVIASAIEISEASKAIEIAEEEVEKFKKQADKYEDKVSNYRSKILRTNDSITQIDYKLNQIRKEVKVMKRQRWGIAELQRKVRSTVLLLSVLSGKVNVMEQQTRMFILHQPVVMVMEEVLKSTREIVGNELLCNAGVLSIIEKMRVNNQRLKAVCASQNTDNDMMQYF
ncbi:uncharacterized protein LOC124391888 [Silurus meridionalis]|uniref:Uncharacterized protein n=1 Tax=Silurus meridionalis TaxID=175797 RepID=A0A8T0B779_SILME|nr:uncharacterized protein LOC124391888 [Silurus meridionalis]KAF7702439.1 hypothetical protein HF521_001722 [Silurus meridionalis]KAI5100809.1 hypothetical protein C0J45_9795 [Silurus meridionalis]